MVCICNSTQHNGDVSPERHSSFFDYGFSGVTWSLNVRRQLGGVVVYYYRYSALGPVRAETQSSVRRLVRLWYAASWADSYG
jgi:hypothetical protein